MQLLILGYKNPLFHLGLSFSFSFGFFALVEANCHVVGIHKVLWKRTWGEIPTLLPTAMGVYHPGTKYCSSSQAFRGLQPQETDILTATVGE